MKAWYFSSEDRRLRHGDGREIRLGETHEVSGEIEMCKNGLHASKKAIDALYYAPGPIVYRVELSGEIKKGEDKLVAQKRTYLSGGIDVSEILRKFARMCALDVVDMWEAPEVVIRYLKTGDKSIRVAAWAAARTAAPDAVWNAALDPAPDAASTAAQDEARRKQNKRLTSMITRAIRDAHFGGTND